MAMGETGTVNITHQMIQDIVDAVDTYRQTASSLATRLQSTVDTLIPGNFSGDAADGFRVFYENSIVPAVTSDLTSLLESIDQMADGIKTAIPGAQGLDDQLGDGNRQSGGGEA